MWAIAQKSKLVVAELQFGTARHHFVFLLLLGRFPPTIIRQQNKQANGQNVHIPSTHAQCMTDNAYE